MNRMVREMMNRGMTEEEAKREFEMIREEVFDAAEDGDFYEAEEIILSSGFDLDFIDYLI